MSPNMERELTQDQLGKVVAELTRLDQEIKDRQRETLDRQQVAELLKELNLPVELLDDAMEKLERREALERAQRDAQRKKRRIIAAVITALLAVILIVSISMWRHAAALGHITAGQARITRATDDGGNLQSVARNGEDVFYRVIIRDAPEGESLRLTVNWIDPSGNLFHQNRYETKVIDKTAWSTFAKCRIGEAAPRGTWKVELLLGDRLLSATSFEVE
ncbi:MAG: DUF3859 domain-containing protein [Acidobacteriota bacterium]